MELPSYNHPSYLSPQLGPHGSFAISQHFLLWHQKFTADDRVVVVTASARFAQVTALGPPCSPKYF